MKPREKALTEGLYSLSEEELLSLILETGSKKEDVRSLSRRLIEENGSFPELLFSNEARVHSYGIGTVKRLRLQTCLEVLRRYSLSIIQKISSLKDCYLQSRAFFYHRKTEALLIFVLDEDRVVSIKRLDSFHSDRICLSNFRFLLPENRESYRFLFVHNHPSQVLMPSRQDILSFHKTEEFLRQEGCFLVDFMIVNDTDFISLRNYLAC